MDSNQTIPNPPAQSPESTPVVSSAPVTPELPRSPEKLLPSPNGNSWGAVIGIAVIIILLILGGLYIWGWKLEKQGEQRDIGLETVPPSDSISGETNSI